MVNDGMKTSNANAYPGVSEFRRVGVVLVPAVVLAMLAWEALVFPKIERMAYAISGTIQKALDQQTETLARLNEENQKAMIDLRASKAQ
ncbi:MAG: hypothetical protein WBW81_05145 [Methylocella sp.]